MGAAKETFQSLDPSFEKIEGYRLSALSAPTAPSSLSRGPSHFTNARPGALADECLVVEAGSELSSPSGLASPLSPPKTKGDELVDADRMPARDEHMEQGEFPEWSRANIAGDEGTVANTMKNRSQTSVKSHLMLARLCQRLSWEVILKDKVEDQAWEGIRADIRDRISIYSPDAPIPTRRPESSSESEDYNSKEKLLGGSRFTTSFASTREGGLYSSPESEGSAPASESSHERRVSFASVAKCRKFRS